MIGQLSTGGWRRRFGARTASETPRGAAQQLPPAPRPDAGSHPRRAAAGWPRQTPPGSAAPWRCRCSSSNAPAAARPPARPCSAGRCARRRRPNCPPWSPWPGRSRGSCRAPWRDADRCSCRTRRPASPDRPDPRPCAPSAAARRVERRLAELDIAHIVAGAARSAGRCWSHAARPARTPPWRPASSSAGS